MTRALATSLRANLVALPPAASRPPSKARKLWWLWTAIGATAAAGAGVGLYFGLRPTTAGTADAALSFQVR